MANFRATYALATNISAPSPPANASRQAQAQTAPKQYANSSILPGVLAPPKPRYVGRHSSVAFPLYTGLEVQATKLPRLHSFGYHAGVRREPECAVTHAVADRIPWRLASVLIHVYATVIHPVFGFLNLNAVNALCEKHWSGEQQDMIFEAMICGIIAMGSLFSDVLDEETEMWVVLHAKEILEDAAISRFPSVESIAAWILRTLYLRSAGLHQAPEFQMQATGNSAPDGELINIVNRTAQVANAVHFLIAFEYGRSIMTLNRRAPEIAPQANGEADFTSQLCSLVAAMPTNQDTGDLADLMNELLRALEAMSELTLKHDFLLLVRADISLGIYRRLRVMDPSFQRGQNELVMKAGSAALPAAERLASLKQPWWNVVGSVFQFACALLVMDTNDSCEKLGETMRALEFIVSRFNTHLAKEALGTARQLITASLNKKRKSVEALERAVGPCSPGIASEAAQVPQNMDFLSPSLMPELPVDVEQMWAMEFQLP
ncbi:hypothetical protein N7470_000309 [Penicillium chermesinum]|nr:hypothetical protein N7470_000309 [Penicillium chermesinum]